MPFKTIHGHGRKRQSNGKYVASLTYRSWSAMKGRCTNPNSKDYPTYAPLGLEPAWYDFAAFLADMGERPSKAHSIDRIDTTKGYFKGNCRWATKWQQARNRSMVKLCAAAIKAIRDKYDAGLTQQVLALDYGIHQTHVSRIVRKVSWNDEAPF